MLKRRHVPSLLVVGAHGTRKKERKKGKEKKEALRSCFFFFLS